MSEQKKVSETAKFPVSDKDLPPVYQEKYRFTGRKTIEGVIEKKADVTLYDISFTLKGTKTLKEIFAEAERLYPEKEEAQCRHAAATMKQIGFTVSTKISGS